MPQPKVIIFDRPDKSYGPKGRAKPCVFCWYYNPSEHTVVRYPCHMKRLKKFLGDIPGLLVERTRSKLEALLPTFV